MAKQDSRWGMGKNEGWLGRQTVSEISAIGFAQCADPLARPSAVSSAAPFLYKAPAPPSAGSGLPFGLTISCGCGSWLRRRCALEECADRLGVLLRAVVLSRCCVVMFSRMLAYACICVISCVLGLVWLIVFIVCVLLCCLYRQVWCQSPCWTADRTYRSRYRSGRC